MIRTCARSNGSTSSTRSVAAPARTASGGAVGRVGLATGIAGMVGGERVFAGQAGHAGTVPMEGRHDALVAAAEYVLHVRAAAAAIDGAVATVGVIDVEPGAVNVIPGRVRVSVDARAPDRERLDRLTRALELGPEFR